METMFGERIDGWVRECLFERLEAFEESAAPCGQTAWRDAAIFASGVTCGASMVASSLAHGQLLMGGCVDDCLRSCYVIAVRDADGGAE